jgi:hypothetical protein
MLSKLSYLNTEAFLQESKAFAEQVQHPDGGTGSSGTTVHHHHTHSHFGSPAWGWGGGWGYYPQTVYVGSSGSSRREEKKDSTLIAVLAAGAALIVLYPTAQNWAEWSQATNGMAKVREKLRAVQPEIANAHPALRNTVHAVDQKEMALLDHLRTDARNGFCWKGLFFASLSAASYMAWYAMPIPPVAIAGGVLSVGAMIWRSGIRSIENEVQQDARELQIAVDQAAKVLDTIKA